MAFDDSATASRICMEGVVATTPEAAQRAFSE